MEEKTFLKSEAIKTGWNKTGSNILFFVGLLFVAGLVVVVPAMLTWGLENYSNIILAMLSAAFGNENLHLYIEPYVPFAIIVLGIVSVVFEVILQIGFIKIAIKINDDVKCRLSDLFTNFRLFFKFLIGSIIYVFIAFAALLLPAVFVVLFKNQLQQFSVSFVLGFVVILFLTIFIVAVLTIRLGFFGYFITDKRCSPITAIKSSAKLTKGSTGNLLLLNFFIQGINVIGAAFFFIGLFITIPIGLIAKASVYRKLLLKLDEGMLEIKPLEAPHEEKQEILNAEVSQIDHELPGASMLSASVAQDSVLSEVNSILNHEEPNEISDQLENVEPEYSGVNIDKKSGKNHKLKKIFGKLPDFKLYSNKKKGQKDAPIINIFAKYNFSVELVISSICIVFSIVLFFLFFQTLKSKNMVLKDDLSSKISTLNRLQRKGRGVYNEKWIQAKEEDIKYCKSELSACKEILMDRDRKLEKVFVDVNDIEVTDEALWKRHYRERCNYIRDLLDINDVNVNEKSFNLKTWDFELPTIEEIATEQKRFWIQNEIVNIIIKNKYAINEFYYLNFKDKPLVENKSTSKLFNAIPIKLQLKIENTRILYLISDILGSDLNIFIESVKVEMNKNVNNHLAENTEPYIVTLDAYVMDFNNKI